MPGLWQTVCGKVEANESSINACIRETIEETGIDIDPKRPKFLFNDRTFNCDVYLTKTNPSEIPKRTEPAKMSKWKTINKEQYKKLYLAKLMTDTHNEEHQQIIDAIQQNGNWNTWGEDVDPLIDLEKLKRYHGKDSSKKKKTHMK